MSLISAPGERNNEEKEHNYENDVCICDESGCDRPS